MNTREPQEKTGLVLSGGGARGAYAVGVVQGLVEILGLRKHDRSPFQIFSGTSVGSLNAGFMAAHAQRGDLAIRELKAVWTGLHIDTLIRKRTGSLDLRQLTGGWFSESFLDGRPLEQLIRAHLPFEQLHKNIADGTVQALMVAAFNLRSGRTTIFSELHEELALTSSQDPSRQEHLGPLHLAHILGSSALPFVFPACKIGSDYYVDGGIRFNTPISPAIRAGASRLVVISLANPGQSPLLGPASYPSVPFVLGRILDALLVDPVDYDLEVLQRINRLSATLKQSLSAADLARLNGVFTQTRGAPFREIATLSFSPSIDLGKLANEHLRSHLSAYKLGAFARYFLKKAAAKDATWEADGAAYMLFDGSYAAKLIELGRKDAWAKQEAVRDFFPAPLP